MSPTPVSMSPTPRSSQPLNVVVLYADDWRHDTLGLANPVVSTPNLDRLAKGAVRFTHNCVTTSVCWVSRASFYTGQWMSRHGYQKLRVNVVFNETFYAKLREHGYHTGHVGKWQPGKSPRQGRDIDVSKCYYGSHWIRKNDTTIHVTQQNEEDALDFLKKRPKGKPFALTVAFFAPHAMDSQTKQYFPMPKSSSLYQGVSIPEPSNASKSWSRLPSFLQSGQQRIRWHWRFDTPSKYQIMMKKYFRLVSEVDAACGRVLAELKRQGLLNTTMVIFTTDNGYFHGERQWAGKWYPHEESLRVPLIIHDPRRFEQQGAVVDKLTLNVDLAPTILAAARVPPPERMQGRDLAPLYLRHRCKACAAIDEPWRHDFYYEYKDHTGSIQGSEAVVSKQWKYVYWVKHKLEQLFNVMHDPKEEQDLASSPKHATRMSQMRARLEVLRRAAQ